MCAATGVTTVPATDGDTIGPPAENEYAVEPVGVATITPSAENVVTYVSSTSTASPIRRCRALFSTMTSFSAHCGCERAALGFGQDREPFLDADRPRENALEHLGRAVRLDLGEEPEVADLDAEHRHVSARGEVRRPQEGAVASDRDDQVEVVGERVRRRFVFGVRTLRTPDLNISLAEPALELVGGIARFASRRMHDETHPLHAVRPIMRPSATASSNTSAGSDPWSELGSATA